jgi:hypothetical protein
LNIFSTKDDFLGLSDLEEDTEDVVELFNFFFRGEQKSGDLKENVDKYLTKRKIYV